MGSKNYRGSNRRRNTVRWIAAAVILILAGGTAAFLPHLLPENNSPPSLGGSTTTTSTTPPASDTTQATTTESPASTTEATTTTPYTPPETLPRDPNWPALPELPAFEDTMNPLVDPLRSIDPALPMVALTFDDGPAGSYTRSILETLADHRALATFFMLGDSADKYPEVARLVAEAGHDIGIHSWIHKQYAHMSAQQIQDDVLRAYNVISEQCGIAPRWIRTPYGEKNEKILQNLALPLILWNVDSEDWRYKDVASLPGRIMSAKIKDGDIILLHDIMSNTVQALDTLITQLKQAGFQLVTISELFRYREMSATPGHYYYSLPRNVSVN